MTDALLRRTRNAPFLLIAPFAILACSFAVPEGATLASADQTDSPASFEQLVNDTLNLQASELITLDIDPTPGIDRSIVVTIEGEDYTLELKPHSVRAESYQVLMEFRHGESFEYDPLPERTVRGYLEGLPESLVAGSVLDDGLHVVIILDEENTYWIEPLGDRVAGAAEGEHVVYHASDVIASGGKCGNDAADMQDQADADEDTRQAAGHGECGEAELGCDADEEYLNAHGGSVAGVVNRIELVINTVNVQYENQVGITHLITAILIHTNPPGTLPDSGTEGENTYPYTSTAHTTLLNQLISHWNSFHNDIPRDLVHLFTGKNLNGDVIGVANCIGCVCTSGAFCLSQSDCCGSNACSTDLTAHELGHVWNGQHCDPCNTTMRSFIGCFNNFGSFNINRLTNHRNSSHCLSCLEDGTTPLPFFDDFPSTTIDPDLWTGIDGAAANNSGDGEPSTPNSLNLDSSDEIRSATMDTSGNDLMVVSYWWQRAGNVGAPEPGEDLFVEFTNVLENWIELNVHPGEGPDDDPYQFVEIPLPAAARHANFRLRFRATGGSPNDDWFVDNVFIGPPPEDATTTLPFSDEFPSTEINSELWIGVEGASIDGQGAGEPSPPFSLNIDGVDEIRSANMDTTGGVNLTLNYSWQQTGDGGDSPEINDPLIVEYFNDQGEWVEINSHPGAGPDAEPYEPVSLPLPADALHDSFRFRFRGSGTTGGEPGGFDDWFVDNVCVGTAAECQTGQPCDGPQDCDDGVVCTDDDCLSNFCVNTPANAACDDGIACTADVCVAGSGCVSTPDDAACDDGNDCTLDSCDAGSGCANAPDVGLPCDDGQDCTIIDTCDAGGQCVGEGEGCVVLEAQMANLPICQDTSQDNIDVPLDVCKVYVHLTSIDHLLLSVGDSEITTTDPNGFYQNPFNAAVIAPTCSFVDLFPDLICDSFITIGLECGPEPAGTDGTGPDGNFDASEFASNGHVVGGWFNSSPENGQGDPGPDLRVLVAQFSVAQGQTVSGTLSAFVRIPEDPPLIVEFPNLEFFCTGETVPCNVACPTDVDFNGQTGAFDLAVLLGCWGPVTPGEPCACLDADGDMTIGAFDLAILLGTWGACS